MLNILKLKRPGDSSEINILEERAQMINYAIILRYGLLHLKRAGKTFKKLREITKLLRCSIQNVRGMLELEDSEDEITAAYQRRS